MGALNRSHQAGIKAYELEVVRHFTVDIGKRAVYLAKGKGVVIEKLVKADARDASAAMIPQYHAHVCRRIVLHSPFQEVGKG